MNTEEKLNLGTRRKGCEQGMIIFKRKNSMEELLEKVKELRIDCENNRKNDRFNVVTALHKERDEVNLHSRIISYLLSTTAGHDMKDGYLKLFVRKILKLDEEKFDLSAVTVLPNENQKSEYKDIDLLIVNKSRSQAIIIENKIDAKDSNNDSFREGYKGQLERYYNTIKSGYDNAWKECKEYQCNQVFVFYLGFNRKPSEISIGMLSNEPDSWQPQNILSYDAHIREWLAKCIEDTPNEKLPVKTFIQHYSNLVDRLTHNDIPMKERIALKNMVAEHIEDSKYLIENFKHVKWHTVHEFWTELKRQLEDQSGFQCVSFFADGNIDFNTAIERITHQNKEINHGLTFEIGDKKAYISGLGKLSWGIVNPKKWTNFNDDIADISFSDFSSGSTYSLIEKTTMINAVGMIIDEIKASEKRGFENLRTI